MDKKFNLFDFMIEIHQNFLKQNPDVECMCVLDSLAVGNYNNRQQYLFLKRFSWQFGLQPSWDNNFMFLKLIKFSKR